MVSAEERRAERRAAATIPAPRGDRVSAIRTGRASSGRMAGKRSLAAIPREVMTKARGTRIRAAAKDALLAVPGSEAEKSRE